MKIVVSADGPDLDAPASPVFGRCPMYVFVDTDSMASEDVENPAINAAGGGRASRRPSSSSSVERRRWSLVTWGPMLSTSSSPPAYPPIFSAAGRWETPSRHLGQAGFNPLPTPMSRRMPGWGWGGEWAWDAGWSAGWDVVWGWEWEWAVVQGELSRRHHLLAPPPLKLLPLKRKKSRS